MLTRLRGHVGSTRQSSPSAGLAAAGAPSRKGVLNSRKHWREKVRAYTSMFVDVVSPLARTTVHVDATAGTNIPTARLRLEYATPDLLVLLC